MTLTAPLRRPLERIETSLSRPTGRLGIAVGHAMSLQHHPLTAWCHRLLDPPPDADVLDVGCGSGNALRLLGRRCSGRLAGVDPSPTMIGMTRRANARADRAGRLRVRIGSAERLPFHDDSFDVVTAIETLYFWPDVERGLRETLRILRPGGRLAVALEMTRDAADPPTWLQRVFGAGFTERSAGEGLSILSGVELTALVRSAGFDRVRFAVEPRRSLGWLCVLARKPDRC
jgi:SAM-dependent methyltransferase